MALARMGYTGGMEWPFRFLTVIAASLLAAVSSAQAAQAVGPFPPGFNDHAASRLRYQPSVIAAAPAKALKFEDAFHSAGGKGTWISVRDSGKDFLVLFSALPNGSAPSAGDVLFRRNAEAGTIIDIRVELDPSIGSYLVLRAKNSDRTYLSVFSGGKAISSDVELKSPIFYLFTVPMTKIVDLAEGRVPWNFAFAAEGADGDADQEENAVVGDSG
jgi:hypothetical protein